MNLRFVVKLNGELERRLREAPKQADQAAFLAVNDTLRYARRLAKKKMLEQVSFPASYLDQSRLSIIYAKRGGLPEGSIVGRRRPTSLARFDPKKKQGGVSVRVKKSRKTLPRAFLVNLKRGKSGSGNVGLAMRVDKGDQPRRRFRQSPLFTGKKSDVYLLYGPSVQQVFDDVAEDIQDEVGSYLTNEFNRQFDRLRKN